MPTSYTSLLGLALPVTGELSGTWGDTVNNSITSLLDTAVAGTTTVSADTTLTTTSGAANQARSAIILASGHVANITITAPAQSKIYTVINTSGTYTVTFRGVGPTTGITLGANEKALLAWNGSDFVRIGGSGGAGVFSSITNTSLTSGRVVYSTTGGLETDSANLTFDGSTFGIGVNTLFDNSKELRWKNTSGVARPVLQIYSDNNLYLDSEDGAQIYRTLGTERMRLTSTGLGIGTTSPSYKLDVVTAGTSGARVTTAEYGQFVLTDGTRSMYLQNYVGLGSIGTASNNALGFAINSVEKMRLDTSGNLGIGTSSPSYTVQAVGATNGRIQVEGTSGFGMVFVQGSSGNSAQLQLNSNGGSGRRYAVVSDPSGNFVIGDETAVSARVTIDSSGNLLLGTTTNYNSAGFAKTFSLYDASSINISLTNASKQYQIGVTGTSLGIYDGTASAYRMYLDTSGNLGIGTTSPARKLDVAATMRIADGSSVEWGGTSLYIAGTSNTLLFATSSSERMRLDSSGNLGIGTSSPTAKLDVRGTLYQQVSSNPTNAVAAIITNQTTVSNNGVRLQFDVYNIGSAGLGVPSDSAALAFYSGGITTERMRLDSSGNLIVGGTSAALGLVSVQGTGNYNAISAETSSATSTDFAKIILRKTSTPPNSSLYAAYNGAVDFYSKAQNGASGISGRILNFAYSVNSDTTVCVGNTRVSAFGTSSTLGEYALAELRLGSGTTGVAQIYCFDGSAEVQSTETRYDYFRPGQDNYSTLGASGRRWTTVYATTGTINTSDRNDKQDIEELSAAEQRVAVRVKGLIRKFRFKDSVAVKGDNARIHFGVIAQDVQGAFTAEGLDASRYGLFCSDTFKAIDGKAVEKDENGQYPEGATDYTRLGVRYEELLAFVISAI